MQLMTATGRWKSAGDPSTGAWTVDLVAAPGTTSNDGRLGLTDTEGRVMHPPVAWATGRLVDGALVHEDGSAVRVPVADDPGLAESGFWVRVKVEFGTGTPRMFWDVQTAGLDGQTVDLTQLVDPTDYPDVPGSLLRGVPGGIAGLDLDGDVVDAAGVKVLPSDGGAGPDLEGYVTDDELEAALAVIPGPTPPPDLTPYALVTSLPDSPGDVGADPAGTARSLVDAAVSQLLGGAPAAALDTLAELADALGDEQDATAALIAALAGKAESADLAAVATSGAYADLAGRPTIPTTPAQVGADPAGSAAAAQSAAVDTANAYTNTAVTGEATARALAITRAVADLVGSAPGALDTLAELAAQLGADGSALTALTNVVAGKQPADDDLTQIAALTTTTFGRTLLTLANAQSGRDALGLGTAATQATSAFDAAGAATTARDFAVQRGNHTGQQLATTVDETADRKWQTAAERTKLAGLSNPTIASVIPVPLTEAAVNTSDEVTLATLTINPADVAAGNELIMDIAADVLNSSGSTISLTIAYYLGGVLVFSSSAGLATNALRAGFYSRASIVLASLTDQRWSLRHSTSTPSAATALTVDATPRSGVNTSAANLAVAQPLTVTVKWAAAGATAVRLHSAVLRRAR